MENKIIKVGSNCGLAEAWNQALYDLGFGSLHEWYSDGVTGVEIHTEESGVPTLAIYKDEEVTIHYPLVCEFREMYPQYDVIDDLQYEAVRTLRTSIDLVWYKSTLHALKIIQESDDLELFLN